MPSRVNATNDQSGAFASWRCEELGAIIKDIRDIGDNFEADQHLAALVSNVGAVRAVTEAVQGTLGPKGLDCLLIDEHGGLVVTNDGVTILKTMDVTHPAARMLIDAAAHQDELVGDGTTTATVITGALISEAANQILRGVPVMRVIDGIKAGIAHALDLLGQAALPTADVASPALAEIARIAARNHPDIAALIIRAARELGEKKLLEPGFCLADQVLALEGSESRMIRGTIVDRLPLNENMPRVAGPCRILILDDALEPLTLDGEALGTETGVERWLQYEQELQSGLAKIAALQIKAIFTDRAISDLAEERLTDYGIIGVQRVARAEWLRLAAMSGARPLKRNGLLKPAEELVRSAGEAAAIEVDPVFRQMVIFAPPRQQFVTILAGAHTREVVREKERIARDAAAAVQAAVRGGRVCGGGSVEISLARKLQGYRPAGLSGYGFDCVVLALQQPLHQICANAGLNPIEKVAEVMRRQEAEDSDSLGVNCETGAVEDFVMEGVWDPYLVKLHAIKTAGEVAEAILRIGNIIKMKQHES